MLQVMRWATGGLSLLWRAVAFRRSGELRIERYQMQDFKTAVWD